MKVMIVGSKDDLPRKYGWYYLQQLAQVSRNSGNKTVLLNSPTVSDFEKEVKQFNPQFVIMNGHGGDRAIVVRDHHALLGAKGYSKELNMTLVRENLSLMEGRDVYLFTCNTAKLLAPALIKAGAKSVVAYDEPFFWSPGNVTSTPPHDSYATPVFQSALEYPIQVFKGKPVGVAYQMMVRKYTHELDKTYDVRQGKYLLHDLKHLRKFGFNPTF